MHLWAHLQGGEAMGRCPFRATRPGGCRSGDHIHEAVTASPRTRPKRSPQGHRLLPHQQRTDALRPVSEPRSLCRFGSGRSRLQDYHRATTEAVGNALDSRPRQRNYRPSLFPAQWPLGRILGTTRRWLISARFFTYKFGAHPGRCEDLFFYVQDLLVQMCGEDAAGKMHTARSRNDIDLTLYRMQLRLEVLRIAEETAQGRQVLMELAEAHTDTVMPAHTHTQPAQPTTLAHYLLGAVEFLGRDVQRLRAAFATINRSPLGACAITTTGFPIHREYTARLLGFDGLQENSYGAIAATDYVCEAATSIAVLMVSLSKLVQDLLLWCTEEFHFLRLSDAYVQTSSIMPQKRN